MSTRIFRLSLLVLAVSAGAPLWAQTNSAAYDEIALRNFTLDLLDKQAREQSERQEAAQQQSWRRLMLTAFAFDANHDGTLDAQELATWQQAVRRAVEKDPAVLRRFDVNTNSKLDDAEWVACWKLLTAPAAKTIKSPLLLSELK